MRKREYEKQIRELNNLVQKQNRKIEEYEIQSDAYYMMLGQNRKIQKAYNELLNKYTQQTATLRLLLGITEKEQGGESDEV